MKSGLEARILLSPLFSSSPDSQGDIIQGTVLKIWNVYMQRFSQLQYIQGNGSENCGTYKEQFSQSGTYMERFFCRCYCV